MAVILGTITFVSLMFGTITGMLIRNRLPEHHLGPDSRDTVKLGAGLIATLSALVLGLLVSSAKDSFDNISTAMTQSGVKLILLDRMLAHYGPETEDIRRQLAASIVKRIELIWPEHDIKLSGAEAFEKSPATAETVSLKIRALVPKNNMQENIQKESLQLCGDILQIRWQTIEQAQVSLPPIFLVILIFWLIILFTSFGLLAPTNKTVLIVLIVCALSVAGAIFLIEEMNQPLMGIIKISKAPLVKALENMGK